MRFGNARAGMFVALLFIALFITGCGGGSSSSSSTTTSEGASAAFIKKGHLNVIPKFGKEAPVKEREEANVVVSKSLKAREAADFSTQCETLGRKGLEEVPGAKSAQACAAALKKYAEPLAETKEARKDTLKGSIAVLRVKGDRGYALYHGADGKDYSVPLEKENGSWKVSSLLTSEL
jgi:hypothetical protein